MVGVLVFALTLLVAVLISDLAHRSVLSTAVLFLAVGFALGGGSLGLIDIPAENEFVKSLSELALFSVLFTDGMHLGVRELASVWRLPGRALLLGLPLTLLGTALLGHWVAGLPWLEAFLLGAILSPTDPVFASAVVGREEVPARLRQLLNIESGFNDGLALPIVVALLALADRSPDHHPLLEAGEAMLGIVVGIVVPWMAIRLERSRFFSAHSAYAPLNAFAIGLIVLSLSKICHVNDFLAAFAAGITIASISPEMRQAFHGFGTLVAELLKLAALLVFGIRLSPQFFAAIPWTGYLFGFLVLILPRTIGLGLALLGSPLDWRERLVAAWFGPKGFASVVFGLLVLHSALARADELFHLAALVIAASIVAHSSTDVLVAHWFARLSSEKETAEEEGDIGPQPAGEG